MTRVRHPWTEREDQALRTLWPLRQISIEEIGRIIGRTSVRSRATILGLPDRRSYEGRWDPSPVGTKVQRLGAPLVSAMWAERQRPIPIAKLRRRVAVAAVLAVLPLLAASPASAGLVYEAQRQTGTPTAQLHRYQLINEGEMFRETGDSQTWLDWRKLVYVRVDVGRRGPGGDPVGWLVMAEPADIIPADVGGGGGNGVVIETPRPVPVPAAIWMFPVALLALVGMAWRRIVG